MMFNFNTECIVYLDFLKNNGDGNCEAHIDFRMDRDLKSYASMTTSGEHQEVKIQEIENTYIILYNLKTNKRLRSKCYYKLNLEELKKYSYIKNQESSYIWRIYDFEEQPSPIGESEEILQSHSPLDPTELLESNSKFEEFSLPDSSTTGYWELFVRDVGQANWNELLEDGNPKLVYDLGAPTNASRASVSALFNSRANLFEKNKPILVISHWDIDHYHCLINLSTQDLIKYFSKVVYVNAIRSITSSRVLRKITAAIGPNNVYSINPAFRTNGIKMHRLITHRNFSLYVGEKSSNVNYSGLCLFFRGSNKSVNLTGDLKLSQANDVYQQEKDCNLTTQEHILIAPHHGGNVPVRHRCYVSPTSEVIISVGAGNPYGHPHNQMLNYYLNLCCGNVLRTDLNGDILEKV